MDKIGKFILGYGVTVGTYRGIVSKNFWEKDDLYTSKIVETGINVGAGIFLNTILFPVSIYRTAKRVEINIRGLEEEKSKWWYKNDIL